jgi:predicted TIM-barrel fold metal-dependent hydrolase
MIIDAHYHLEVRLETVDRLLDQMRKHGIDRVALIPVLSDPFHLGIVANTLSGIMRKALSGSWNNIGLFMYNTTVTRSGKFSVMGKTYCIYEKPDNESTAQVMKAHPDKFLAWIGVNPKVADPIPEMEKWAGKPGWIGVKCHPFWHCYPVAMLDNVAAYCSERSLPILIHLGGNKERGDYKFLPERHPKLKIIYAHAGVPYYGELWQYIKVKGNLFVDLSSPYLDESLRLAVLKTLGAQKCLYGSDGPYGYPDDSDGLYDHGAILGEIMRAPLSDSDKELILNGNFKAIIKM